MQLRKLEQKDAPLMLEWMHDPGVVQHMGANFAEKTVDDCKAFIAASRRSQEDLHLAIVDDTDTYMGTVSLKHIDPVRKDGEFAITVRACAMGKGYSRYAISEIIRIGLQEQGLDKVYWCVSPRNERAVRFYDKCGYPRVDKDRVYTGHYTPEQADVFIWYAVSKQ